MWVIFAHLVVLWKKSGQRVPRFELGTLSLPAWLGHRLSNMSCKLQLYLFVTCRRKEEPPASQPANCLSAHTHSHNTRCIVDSWLTRADSYIPGERLLVSLFFSLSIITALKVSTDVPTVPVITKKPCLYVNYDVCYYIMMSTLSYSILWRHLLMIMSVHRSSFEGVTQHS